MRIRKAGALLWTLLEKTFTRTFFFAVFWMSVGGIIALAMGLTPRFGLVLCAALVIGILGSARAAYEQLQVGLAKLISWLRPNGKDKTRMNVKTS